MGNKKRRFKDYLPSGLMGRSILIIALPAFLVQAILVTVFIDNHWSKMTGRLAYAVAGEVAVLSEQLDGEDAREKIEDLSRYSAQYLDLLISYSSDMGSFQEGENLTGGWQQLVGNTLRRELNKQVKRPVSIYISENEKRIEINVLLEHGVLHVSVLERRLFSSSSYIFLLWMVVTTLVLFAVAILFMRNQVRPIRKLAIAAERFGKGRDVSGFKPEGAREVRRAGRAFMDMRDRLNRQISQRTAMLAGISHDLRTPLTRMKLQVAMLPNGEDADDLKSDIIDMEKMLDGYLEFVRGEGEETVRRIDIKEIIESIVSASRRSGKDVEYQIPDNLMLPVRAMAFERALGNLVGNGLKYGDKVWIFAHHIDDYIEIMVDDDGPGLSEGEMEDVFRPFVRGDASRNSDTGGVGLGLSIAREIVFAHGGDLWLERSNRGGLRAVLHIPI